MPECTQEEDGRRNLRDKLLAKAVEPHKAGRGRHFPGPLEDKVKDPHLDFGFVASRAKKGNLLTAPRCS